jgi:hypothetical protein
MLRFVLTRYNRDQGHVSRTVLTVDAEVPILEREITRGGYGSGPNGDDFQYAEVVSVEVIRKPSEDERVFAAAKEICELTDLSVPFLQSVIQKHLDIKTNP